MASKRRLRRKACAGKIRFSSFEDGLEKIREIRSNGRGGGLIPYKCPFCGGWHLGHPPKEVQQKISADRRSA